MSATAKETLAAGDAAVGSGPFVKGDPGGAEDMGNGIRRQILGYGDQLMGVRVWFEAGAVGTLHQHPHSQMAYVESGRFLVTVGDNEMELGAGDSFFAPPHTDHGAVCLEAGVLIDVFSPVREDFLAK